MLRRELHLTKSIEDYQAYRKREIEQLIAYKDTVESNKHQVKLHPKGIQYSLCLTQLFELILAYSIGENKQELKSLFINNLAQTITTYPNDVVFNIHNKKEYHYALWVVSLGILLEIDTAVFRKIVTKTHQSNKDGLIDILVAKKLSRTTISKIKKCKKSHKLLLEATQILKAKAPLKIDGFLKKYYTSLNGLWWYNSHLKDDARFFGYWSFEAAAITRLFKIKDTVFANSNFYPRDLIDDKKLFRPWLEEQKEHEELNEDLTLEEKIGQKINAIQGDIGTIVNKLYTPEELEKYEELEDVHLLAAHALSIDLEQIQKDDNALIEPTLKLMKLLKDFIHQCRFPSLSQQKYVRDLVKQFQIQLVENDIDLSAFIEELPIEFMDLIQDVNIRQIQQLFAKQLRSIDQGLTQILEDSHEDINDLIKEIKALFFGINLPFMNRAESKKTSPKTTKESNINVEKPLKKRKAGLGFTFKDIWNTNPIDDK